MFDIIWQWAENIDSTVEGEDTKNFHFLHKQQTFNCHIALK